MFLMAVKNQADQGKGSREALREGKKEAKAAGAKVIISIYILYIRFLIFLNFF